MTLMLPTPPTILYPGTQFSNVQPFTYRSAVTNIEYVETIKKYIIETVIPWVAARDNLLDEQIGTMIEDVNNALIEQANSVNEIVEQIIGTSIELNDFLVTQIAEDDTTTFAEFLDANFKLSTVLSLVVASDPVHGGLHPWNGTGVPQDSWAGLQAARLKARINKTECIVPPGIYYVSRTLAFASSTGTTTSAHKFSGVGSLGSLFDTTGLASVEIRPLPDDQWVHTGTGLEADKNSEPVILAIGQGLEFENIAINGMNLNHDLWRFEQGFELRVKGARAYNTKGTGVIFNDLCNALIESFYVDICGTAGLTGKRGMRIGRSAIYGISNTNTFLNCHIERCRGVHLDLAYGTVSDTDRMEFTDFVGIHIEKVIDNTGLTDFSDDPAVLIGNARGVTFLGGTILGGKGPMVRYDRQVVANPAQDIYKGITFVGTRFLGYVGGANITPDYLIDLVSGNAVTFLGCNFIASVIAHIRVRNGFGADFRQQGNNWHKERPGTTAAIPILDERPTSAVARGRETISATLQWDFRGDRPGLIGGGSSPGVTLYSNEVGGGIVDIADNPTDGNRYWQFDTLNKRMIILTGQAPGANPAGGSIFEWLDPTRNKLMTRDSGGVISEGQQTIHASVNWDCPNITAGGYQSIELAVTNAALGMGIVVAPTVALVDGLTISGMVVAPGSVRLTIRNNTGADINPSAQPYIVKVLR